MYEVNIDDFYVHDTRHIFEFDPVDMSWIQREETLSVPKRAVFAVNVEKERFC